MERAVWVCACAFALSLAVGISSMSSAAISLENPHDKINKPKSLELNTCKAQSTCGHTSEMFLRKLKRGPRIAFA